MRLRIEGTLDKPVVVNADTGEVLEGVERIDWKTGVLKRCEVSLSHAAIDVSIDASRVDAWTHEDGKFAKTRLLDIAGLRWGRAKSETR